MQCSLITLLALFKHCTATYYLNETFPDQNNDTGYFISPISGPTIPSDYSNNPVLREGQVKGLSWHANLMPVNIYLAQPGRDGSWGKFLLTSNLSGSTYEWTVLPRNVNVLPIDNMFALAVYQTNVSNIQQTSGLAYFTSHFVNITSANEGSSSLTNTTSPLASTTATTSSTSNPKSSETGSHGTTSTGAIVGASVGSVAGLVILVAVTTRICIKRVKKNKRRKEEEEEEAYRDKTSHRSSNSQPSIRDPHTRPTNQIRELYELGREDGRGGEATNARSELGPYLPHEVDGDVQTRSELPA